MLPQRARALCAARLSRFYLQIELSTKEIKDAKFKTNGCGFLMAAADVLAEKIKGEKLIGLHGLDENELQTQIEAELGRFPRKPKALRGNLSGRDAPRFFRFARPAN